MTRSNLHRPGYLSRCILPVNGLDADASYIVHTVMEEPLGRVLYVRSAVDGLMPKGGENGYFAWRFVATGRKNAMHGENA